MVRQQESKSQRRRHIPSEIVEEILVNLGVKSLLRFSSVSKLWNSIISDPKFITKHRTSAIQERIVIDGHLSAASTCSVISIDTAKTTPLICPFLCKDSNSGVRVNLLASCGDLWCIHYAGSMFLWNPSTRAYKKLAYERPLEAKDICYYVYGLGYDSLGDDYKIVKISKMPSSKVEVPEVYSLRSDSWRKIEQVPDACINEDGDVVALNGTLHWLIRAPSIVSLNLSTEKYAQVAMPPETPEISYEGITVLRGNLCLHRNSVGGGKFVLWEMQEYGVAESWTKTFVTDYFNKISKDNRCMSLRPLYIYDDGKLLFLTFSGYHRINTPKTSLFIYKDEKSRPQFVSRSVSCGFGYDSCRAIIGPHVCHLFGSIYFESLVSPATYCPPPSSLT